MAKDRQPTATEYNLLHHRYVHAIEQIRRMKQTQEELERELSNRIGYDSNMPGAHPLSPLQDPEAAEKIRLSIEATTNDAIPIPATVEPRFREPDPIPDSARPL